MRRGDFEEIGKVVRIVEVDLIDSHVGVGRLLGARIIGAVLASRQFLGGRHVRLLS